MNNYSFDEDYDEIDELRNAITDRTCSRIFIKEPLDQYRLNQIKSLVQEFGQRSCWLNCLGLFNFDHLFGKILIKILRPDLDPNEQMIVDEHFWNDKDVGYSNNFINKIDSKIKKIKHKHQIIVLENVEILAERNGSYLNMVNELNQSVPNLRFTIVMISNYELDHFHKI